MCVYVCVYVQVAVCTSRRLGGVDVELHALLTSTLYEIQCSALRLGCFIPEEIAPIIVGSRVDMYTWRRENTLAVPGGGQDTSVVQRV